MGPWFHHHCQAQCAVLDPFGLVVSLLSDDSVGLLRELTFWVVYAANMYWNVLMQE